MNMRPLTRPRNLLVILITVLALAVAGCGSSSSSPGAGSGSSGGSSGTASTPVKLAKTKFVLHAGLAFGAFHRYIYKPARAGDFGHPFSHKLTIIKAAAASVFVVHELRIALQDAQSSPLLSKLVSPITALESRLGSLRSDVTSGNTGAITQANSQVGAIESQSASSGTSIQEQVPSTP
jgi:hypothetical protein